MIWQRERFEIINRKSPIINKNKTARVPKIRNGGRYWESG